MNKIKLLILLLFLLFLNCLSVKETESTASREYCINNYRTDSFIVSLLDERKYNEIFNMLKINVLNDDRLSENVKKNDIKNIQNVDYANNKTFYFQFVTNVALAPKDFNFSFFIFDENGNQIIERLETFFLKTTYYNDRKPFAGLDFTYYWIMITNKKFIKNSNWTLVVKFPNNAIKKYSLKSI